MVDVEEEGRVRFEVEVVAYSICVYHCVCSLSLSLCMVCIYALPTYLGTDLIP